MFTGKRMGLKVLSFFENETPDICILDIMLPNTDGFTLCKTIRGFVSRTSGYISDSED